MILSPVRAQREGLASRLASIGVHAALAPDAATGVALLNQFTFDVAVVGEGGSAQEGLAIIPLLSKAQPSISCILAGEEPDLELATAVMRAGGVDLIGPSATRERLEQSLALGVRRSRAIRAGELRQQRRTGKLRSACRELERSRRELLGQFGNVCSDVSAGYRAISDQIKHVSLAAELNAILRQELELESLLRTVLEYLLKKIGSTNAAIFLPSTSGDYTLGAYVNYDCPKDSAESLLDHMAGAVAPAFEEREDIALMRGLGQLRRGLDTDQRVGGADWLEDSTIAAFSCRQEGECMGVVVLFRDRRNPFSPAMVHTLKIIRELFGKQLARVIKTHHRHLPNHQWGGFGADNDDLDMAA
jgi:hypothetical protein